MNIARQRALNIAGGCAAFLVGAGFFVASLYVVRLPVEPLVAAPTPVLNVPACESALRSLGFTTKRSSAELRAERATLDEPQLLLSESSVAISLCHMPLRRFCMGRGCLAPSIPNGVSFALETGTYLTKGAR